MKVCQYANCIKNGAPQPIENFSFLKRQPTKRMKTCIDCMSKRGEDADHRRGIDSAGEKICKIKTCKHGGKPQSIDNFTPLKRVKGAYFNKCKDCVDAGKKNGLKHRETDKLYCSDRMIGYHDVNSTLYQRQIMNSVSRQLSGQF